MISVGAMLGAMVLLVQTLVLGCTAWMVHEFRIQIAVQKRFGVAFDSPYVHDDEGMFEVLAISSVVPDGAFASAGVRPGEIVTPFTSPPGSSLYDLLAELESGESIAIAFLTRQPQGSWRDWPQRVVTVVAP